MVKRLLFQMARAVGAVKKKALASLLGKYWLDEK